MNKKCTAFSNESGASLVAVALFVIAMGLLMTAGMETYRHYNHSQQVIITQQTLDKAQRALITYYAHTGRFPCPASLSAGADDPAFGQEAASPCTVGSTNEHAGTRRTPVGGGNMIRAGALPTRSMNLPDKDGLDGYGHRVIYAVVESMAANGATDVANPGLINIIDRNNNNASRNDAVAVLLSHGGDEAGAWTLDGQQIAPCGSGTTASENCDFDRDYANSLTKSDTPGGGYFPHRLLYISPDMIGK